jgi:hypothetical protein
MRQAAKLFIILSAGGLSGVSSQEERPLPLASNYNTGQTGEGFTPQWQMEMIQKGHHLLLTLAGNAPEARYDERARSCYGQALAKAAELKIPLSFVCPEWESLLYQDERYRNLPPEDCPLVVGLDGKVLDFSVSYPPGKNPGVSPFGPVKWWKEAGRRYSDCELMRELQKAYPGPPYVVFISNNEARKLEWPRVEQCQQYKSRYGEGRSDEFKRKVVGDGYIECYRALVEGFREGLREWRDKAVIGAYGGSPLIRMGRSEGWHEPSLLIPGRLAIEPYYWEAVSPSQYITTWNNNSDFTVYSPQAEAMNLVVERKLYEQARPDIFWEVSVWDAAYRPDPRCVEKPMKWRLEGQSCPWERYAGFVKWVMWMPRARVVRDFRWWHEPREPQGEFPGALNSFRQVMAAVDEVHQTPVLAEFWQRGQLVPNTAHEHPYRFGLPEEAKGENRWFQLDCDANPVWPWGVDTPVEVWSFAYVLGEAPKRQWMLYAQSPRGARPKVAVQLPGYGPVGVAASQSGSYHHVVEETRTVKPVVLGGPPSVRVQVASPFIAPRKPAEFRVADLFYPERQFTSFDWDFGDGSVQQGVTVSHAYSGKGTYAVQLKALDGAETVVSRLLPVFVGLAEEDGLVVRYTMDPSPTDVLYDASGRSNIGVLHGGAWVDDPERGRVLEFDGKGQYVHVYNNPNMNVWRTEPYPSRTTVLWFKAQRTEGRQTLYEEGGSGSGMNLYLDGRKLYGGVWKRDIWEGTWLGCEGIEAGKWYSAALVLREAGAAAGPDRVELYLNGKRVATGSGAQLSSHPGDINLGRNGDTRYHDGEAGMPGDYFAGRLDDLSIYSRALPKSEIRKRCR